MKLLNSKRGEAITIILIVLIIILFLGWLINFTSKECRSNSQCPKDNYCGSDFACHQIPVIEKTTVQNNLILPSVIVGIAIIISAIILKSEKIPKISFKRAEYKEKTEEKANNSILKTP